MSRSRFLYSANKHLLNTEQNMNSKMPSYRFTVHGNIQEILVELVTNELNS